NISPTQVILLSVQYWSEYVSGRNERKRKIMSYNKRLELEQEAPSSLRCFAPGDIFESFFRTSLCISETVIFHHHYITYYTTTTTTQYQIALRYDRQAYTLTLVYYNKCKMYLYRSYKKIQRFLSSFTRFVLYENL